LGTVTNGVVSIDDYWNDVRQACNPSEGGVCQDSIQHVGGANNVLNFNGNDNNGRTQLKWTRKLVSPNPPGDVNIINGQMNAIWGFHPTSKAIAKHLPNTRGPIKINFFTGTATNIDVRAIHGSMMFAIWAVLIPSMSFLARYYKRFPWWFNVHRIVNSIAMLAMIAAFGLAISFTTPHFNIAHTIIGLIVVILGVAQPILGILADKLFDPKRTGTPFFPDRVHWILGWGSLTLALINIILGLQQYGASNGISVAYDVYFAVIVAFLGGFAIYKFFINPDKSAH